jgi:uncharacterized RDD family membrane protein YckC
LAACGYDLLLLIAVIFAFTLCVVALRGGRQVPPETWWFQLSLLAVSGLFFCWFWTHGGQTLGMRAWRIRLERSDGGAVGWSAALARYLAAWLSIAVAGLGFWWGLLNPRRRCWHDMLSSTRLVHTERQPRRTG